MKRIAVIAASLAMTLCLMGAKACNNSDPYGVAAKASLDVAATVHAGADTADKLRVNGTITTGDEKLVLQVLGNVTDLNGSYQTCVKGVHAAGSTVPAYLSCANAFLGSVGNPTFLQNAQIKNEQALGDAEGVVNSVQAILNALIINLQTAPAKP